jgi:hypothetical protein
VESSCEFGIEPTGSMKCLETIEWPNNCWPSSSAQVHGVSQLVLLGDKRQVVCCGILITCYKVSSLPL